MKRSRALLKAHKKLRGRGRGKRPRFHSELLRAAVVTSVSAMDSYFHDKILENARKVIRKREPNFPQDLVQFIGDGQKAEDVVRKFLQVSMRERPLAHVTTMLAKKLNERAFQDPGKIGWGMRLIGVNDFWDRVAGEMGCPADRAKKRIMVYVKRRHGIVHRGDLYSGKKKKHQVRKTTRDFAEECIEEIDEFIHCTEAAIAEAM